MSSSLLQGRQFFCREWAFHKVGQCLDTRSSAKTCGALIMGGPGCGKTAVCCEMVWPTSTLGKQAMLNKKLLAYYFCQAHDIETLSVTNFIHIIMEQLMKSGVIQGYTELIQNAEIQAAISLEECERDPDTAFKLGIINPLSSISPPANNMLLLVDSIDESYLQPVNEEAPGSQTIAELLSRHHAMIPPWLLLVCSARKHSRLVTRMFTGFRKISLDDLRKSHVVRDVQQYILCRLDQEEELRQHLSRETAEMLNHLHIKSNGCFLYLEKVLDGVAENFILLREIREIPGTLNGLYLWLCQRIFKREHFEKIKPILNVILAARRPLTEMELYSCSYTKNGNLTVEEFHEQILSMSKVLIEGKDGTKILFHHSFAEWLLDVKHCTQKYLCQASEGHGMLAMSFTMHAPSLTPMEIQDFALHLAKSNMSTVDGTMLPLWLLQSGAHVANSLSQGLPKDQTVLKLLLDAGAKLPSSTTTNPSAHDAPPAISPRKPVKEPSEEALMAILESGTNINDLDNSGRSMLLNATQEGNMAALKLLLSRVADVQLTDQRTGQAALNIAARQGHVQAVKLLLKHGAEVDHMDSEGWTALRSAAWGGHSEVVNLLLSAKAKVDLADKDGRTALRAAAWGGHDVIVRTLLSYGACVNKADHEGRTPLIAASYMGHADIVEHLLDCGADINHEDIDGRTALSVAALCIPASEGHSGVVSLLLERGAEVDHKDKDAMTPLLVTSYEGHTRVCELLLEYDADADHADVTGRTPLQAAVTMGHEQVVSLLLFWGCAVDMIDSEGRTVLCLACQQGNVEVVRQLLERGLDELHRDNAGWTPIHFAAFEGHSEVLELLIESGVRVTETDNDGRIPLVMAAQEGHLAAVKVLLDHGSPLEGKAHDGKTAFRSAALEGHREVVEYLISVGCDINYKDADGRSTLYVLALENQQNMAELLLENAVEVEARDLEGRTPLHVASWQGHFEMVKLLIKYGANVNAIDCDSRTVLQSAAWQGHSKVVQVLLEQGAKVDTKCNQGATALCIASQEGHQEVVKVLLDHKANPNHADQCGRTASRVALKGGHSAVLHMLEQYGALPMNNGATQKDGATTGKHKQSSSAVTSGVSITSDSCVSTKSHLTASSLESGVHLMTSSYESPSSTYEHGKVGGVSSLGKSSGNVTSSNTGSTDQSSSSGAVDSHSLTKEPLTFTQQLQQCSRNKHRPLSKALTPVNEPFVSPCQERTPSDSPLSDIHMSPHSDSSKSQSVRMRSPHMDYSRVRSVGGGSAGSAHSSQRSVATSEDNEELVWQKQTQKKGAPPLQLGTNKDLPRCGTFPEMPPIAGSGIAMGQRSLSLKSPEIRGKRSHIVTNPNFNVNNSGGISMNGYFNQLANLSDLEFDESENFDDDDDLDSLGLKKAAARPSGLSIKKETPL